MSSIPSITCISLSPPLPLSLSLSPSPPLSLPPPSLSLSLPPLSLPPSQIPIKVIQGALYVRMSVHVYNDINDIKELAAAVNKIITNGGLCKEDQQ